MLPVLLSPDLDNLKSKVLRRWNFFGVIWKKTVSKEGKFHRGVLHKHVIGPLILCLIPAFFVVVDIVENGNVNDVFILVGLFIASENHIFVDQI